MPGDFRFDASANPPCWVSNKDGETLEKATRLRLKIVGTRIDANEIFAIGGPCLRPHRRVPDSRTRLAEGRLPRHRQRVNIPSPPPARLAHVRLNRAESFAPPALERRAWSAEWSELVPFPFFPPPSFPPLLSPLAWAIRCAISARSTSLMHVALLYTCLPLPCNGELPLHRIRTWVRWQGRGEARAVGPSGGGRELLRRRCPLAAGARRRCRAQRPDSPVFGSQRARPSCRAGVAHPAEDRLLLVAQVDQLGGLSPRSRRRWSSM